MSERKLLATLEREGLSVPEAAKILGVGVSTAWTGVWQGKIPSLRIGHRVIVPKKALEKLLESASQSRPDTTPRDAGATGVGR
jgi:excisionase family DNA binding protein